MNDESQNLTDESETASPSETVGTVTGNETEKISEEIDRILDKAGDPKRGQSLKKTLIIAAAALLTLIILLAAGLFVRIMIPFHAELGEAAKPVFPEFLINADVTGINTDKSGEHELQAKILVIFNAKIKLEVSDTTPPELSPRSPVIMPGADNILPTDFIESCDDKQKVTFAFAAEPDFTKSGKASVKATDESGNTTTIEVPYELDERLTGLKFELGTDRDEILNSLSELTGVGKDKITGLDESSTGTQNLRAEAEKLTLFSVTIEDTTPPKAEANNLDILAGTRFIGDEASILAKNVEDESKISYTFEKEPDWDRAGTQTVTLIVSDSEGNSTEVKPKLVIHNIPKEVTVEAGTTSEELKNLLLSNASGELPEFSGDELSYLQLGTYEYTLRGKYSDMTVSVTLKDTIPPVIVMRGIETDRGAMPYPGSFVESFTDATAVSFEYESEPDVNTIGRVYVTIIATDAGGNTTRGTAILDVVADTNPPVIYGVKNIYAYEGDTISYRAGVRAEDASDGRVTVYVDSSNVKANTAGTYKVTYRASDSSGNVATESAYVIIRQVTQSTLDGLADEILDEILTWNMTEREKAEAIYDWCRENLKYSTVTSYLMGYYYKAAYSGYKLHYGNCYTYYAVARSLLTRAGITNQMIQRNNPNRPHYWNLVKIDGDWYHFDTCPQPYPNNDGCFLLTDAEVADYSRSKESGYYDFVRGVYPATP